MVYLQSETMEPVIRKKAEAMVGIPARRIQFYTDNDLVKLDKATGRGKERRYSRDNLLELLVIKELAEKHIELSMIRRILEKAPLKFFSVEETLKSAARRMILVYDDNTILYDMQRDRQTWRMTKEVKIELSKHASVVILNVTKLAMQVV